MPVIPALKALLDALPANGLTDLSDLPSLREAGLEGSNALAAIVAEEPLDVASVDTALVPVDGGEIEVRIYQPTAPGPHPVHVFYHGGGWMAGTIEEAFVDNVCRERTALAGYVTVAVEYRLAPEFKFPIPLEDSYAALLWAVAHAADYDGDPGNVTIGGGSAGGNLSAAIALKARDENGPKISFQILEVPALDLTLSSPSVEQYSGGQYPLPKAEIDLCVGAYLRSPEDTTNPYVSPLLADDVSGLPPALIISSELDPLQMDGSRYAQRLRDAGVPVTFFLGEGHVHGSSQFTKLLPEAAAWRDQVIGALKAHAAVHRSVNM
ncbi:alpha/beta hydrolase [Paenarthrobacter nitroguajacolicus]|uniref:alpha/beta hydrolase n=1 Tax=Paenarthrobacter nitroguajacolicus TaxID=211146 RepID=UPI00343E01A3